MKNYVVAICSMFDNDVQQFKVSSENEYEAVKREMVEICEDDDERKNGESQWQKSDDYPKDMKGLRKIYEELPFSVIEV